MPWWQSTGVSEVAGTCFVCAVQVHSALLHWGIIFINVDIKEGCVCVAQIIKNNSESGCGCVLRARVY